MEGRLTRKYGHGSPERVRKRWEQHQPPKPQSQQQQLQVGEKVAVVYYLCRNRHLEHPHFIEVPLASQEGLFLRDVINRLNVLRGKGMASLYSWSCKRSYKSGFVWHDLAEDDLIVPANGNEYVLKGSELFDSSTSDQCHQPKGLLSPRQEPSKGQSSPPSSSCIVIRGPNQQSVTPTPHVQEDELSPSLHRTSSSSGNTSNSSHGSDASPRLAEYRVHKTSKATNASTQTEEKNTAERRARGNIGSNKPEIIVTNQNQATGSKESSEIYRNEISPPPTSSSTPSSSGKMDTLESLIRAEARKMNSFRILEEDDVLISTGSKLKATNVLMQLITCGSLSVKDHQSFGLIHSYKPRFSHVKFPSPISGSPMMLGERDYLHGDPKTMGLRSDENYLRGGVIEMKKHGKEEAKVVPVNAKSSSFDTDRIYNLSEQVAREEWVVDSAHSKRLPRNIKLASGRQRQVQYETMRSPNSDLRRPSFSLSPDCALSTTSVTSSKGSSLRFSDSLETRTSSRVESFKEDDKIIKIEESFLQELGL